MDIVVIVFAVAAAAVAIAWFFLNRRNPEQAARHDTRGDQTRSTRFYEGADRPAGPDAETMDPEQLGGDHRPPAT